MQVAHILYYSYIFVMVNQMIRSFNFSFFEHRMPPTILNQCGNFLVCEVGIINVSTSQDCFEVK